MAKKKGDAADAQRHVTGVVSRDSSLQVLSEAVSGVGSWRWDLTTRQIEWSPQMCRLFEEDPDTFEGDILALNRERVYPDDRELLDERIARARDLGEMESFRYRIVAKDGSTRVLAVTVGCDADAVGKPSVLYGVVQDVTEQQRIEQVVDARLRLLEYSVSHSLDELLQETLDEAERLTESTIGFYHFVHADQNKISLQAWSTRTKTEFCNAVGKGMHYAIADAGLWVEGVRMGVPAVHNDYRSHPERRGLPQGHADVIRELVVPVKRGEVVCAILGVGNKATPYGQREVDTIQALADFAWEIAERKRTEYELAVVSRRNEQLFSTMAQGVVYQEPSGRIVNANGAAERILGLSLNQMQGRRSVDPRWKAIREDGSPFPGEDHPAMVALRTGQRVGDVLMGVYSPAEEKLRWILVDALPRFHAGEDQPYEVQATFTDITELKRTEQRLSRELDRTAAMMERSIETIAGIVELRDPYTAGHELRVSNLARAVARELGKDDDCLACLRVAGLVHDLGKVVVPIEILGKPGTLLEMEMALVRKHAEVGGDLLAKIDFPWPIADIVRQHHERLDGSGYPHGLKGDEIRFEARVLAVVDTVEAIASHRPYRPARSVEQALATIEEGAGTLFDAAVVEACRVVLERDSHEYLP